MFIVQIHLLDDGDANVTVRNLSLTSVTTEEEALNALFYGETNRMIAETPMNMASTRSHCVFTIYVTAKVPGQAVFRRCACHLVMYVRCHCDHQGQAAPG